MGNKKPIIFFSLIIFLLLLENAVLLYNKFHPERTILGQKLNNVNVSRLSKKQTVAFIKSNFDQDIPLKLSFKQKIFTVRKNEIGAQIDYQKTIDKLDEQGRKGNILQNIVDQNKAFLGLNNLKTQVTLSKPLLLLKVLDLEQQINQNPQPPRPDFSGDLKKTFPQVNGLKVLSQNLSQIIAANIFNPPSYAITIPTQTIVKKYANVDVEKLRQQGRDYTAEPISISSAGIIFTLFPNDLKELLTVTEQADPTDPKKTMVNLALDSQKLNHKLDAFAAKVENSTNSEFNDHDARSAIYGQFYTNTRKLITISSGAKQIRQVLGASTDSKEKVAYLTIDDGPNLVYHPMILDILKEKGVKATFYLVGANSNLYKSTTKRTIDEGHAIGDHSLTHAFLPKLLANQIFDEIKTTQDILNSFLSGSHITLFRPPYGGTNSMVAKNARQLGLKTEFWSIDPRDWTDPSTDDLVNRVVSNSQNGSVILLHSNHFATVRALPLIIDKLKEKGYEFKVQQ